MAHENQNYSNGDYTDEHRIYYDEPGAGGQDYSFLCMGLSPDLFYIWCKDTEGK